VTALTSGPRPSVTERKREAWRQRLPARPVGPAQEENGRRGKKKRRKASWSAGKEMDQQAKMRKGGERNEFPFSFSKSNFPNSFPIDF